jgi:hypothetical protein
MPLSFCPFFYVRVLLYVQLKLHPPSDLYVNVLFTVSSMSSLSYMCSNGLGVRVVVSQLRGHAFESILEQFLLKTKELVETIRIGIFRESLH